MKSKKINLKNGRILNKQSFGYLKSIDLPGTWKNWGAIIKQDSHSKFDCHREFLKYEKGDILEFVEKCENDQTKVKYSLRLYGQVFSINKSEIIIIVFKNFKEAISKAMTR